MSLVDLIEERKNIITEKVVTGAFISLNGNENFGNTFFMIKENDDTNIDINTFHISEINKMSVNSLQEIRKAILNKFPHFGNMIT